MIGRHKHERTIELVDDRLLDQVGDLTDSLFDRLEGLSLSGRTVTAGVDNVVIDVDDLVRTDQFAAVLLFHLANLIGLYCNPLPLSEDGRAIGGRGRHPVDQYRLPRSGISELGVRQEGSHTQSRLGW